MGLKEYLEGKSINEAKKPLLMYASMGNGITVFDKNREEHGDYMKVAHIDRNRKITWYDKKLPNNLKKEIEQYAKKSNPNVSTTQKQKVFKNESEEYVDSLNISSKYIDGKEESYINEETGKDLYRYLIKEYPSAYRKIGEISKLIDWDIRGAMAFCIHLLEDVNAHSSIKGVEKVFLNDLKQFESNEINESINIGRDQFTINWAFLKSYRDDENYLNMVKQEVMKGGGMVRVGILKPDGMAYIYGGASGNVNPYMNDVVEPYYSWKISVPKQALIKSGM